MLRIRPVRPWFACGLVALTACAIEPRFVDERSAPDGTGSGGLGGTSHGGSASGAPSNAGSLTTTDGCVTPCLTDVTTGPGLSCKFCHAASPAPQFSRLDLESPNLALRLRDRPALHTDLPPGSVCQNKDDLLIDSQHPEQSWLLKKVRSQQAGCGERMPQGAPPLGSDALACLEQYVECVARGAAAVSTNTGGAASVPAQQGGAAAPSGTGGSGPALPFGEPLTPVDGWIDGAHNSLGLQGALFGYADDSSQVGMFQDFAGDHACIQGVAARVDLKCTPVPPASDCYGTFWGAAIGLNLNQVIEPETMMGGPPMPFDATGLDGFAFEISGNQVPSSLRFQVETVAGEFCSPPPRPVRLGVNSFRFSDLSLHCWTPGGETAERAKSQVVKIAWHVVTNSLSEVPFDFCVSSLLALRP